MAANQQHILSEIPKLRGRKILVVGDVGVDEYLMGRVSRISPEAPVPVLDVENEEVRLGLSANVAQNVVSLGGEVFLVSAVGQDEGAERLSSLLRQASISSEFLVTDKTRATTRKTRVMTGQHHIVRVDHEHKRAISAEVEGKILQQVDKVLPQVDALILQDYAKGVMTESILAKLMEMGKRAGKRVLLDPHRDTPVHYYKGVDLLKPNYDEALVLSGLKFDELQNQPNKVESIAQALKKLTGAKELVITQGRDGMSLFSGDKVSKVPTYARKVFDVTGAGDTVIAALALGLASNLDLVKSCTLANFAAGVVIGKVGCVPCTVGELESYIKSFSSETI